MIEKLGHTKRIQTMRKEWIDEEKRKIFNPSEPPQEGSNTHELPTRPADAENNAMPHQNGESSTAPGASGGIDGGDQDLFLPDPDAPARPVASHPEPDDDDLDDLLREQDEMMSEVPGPPANGANDIPDGFDAEYEAMNELGM